MRGCALICGLRARTRLGASRTVTPSSWDSTVHADECGATPTQTALVGCRVKDGHLFEIGVWQARKGEDDWEAPEQIIDAAVIDAFKRYKVVGMYADPALWEARVTSWEQQFARKLKVSAGAHPMQWATSRASAVVKAAASFEEAVVNGDLSHDGSYRLTEHCLNAR